MLEERQTLQHDPRWTEYLEGAEHYAEKPLKPPTFLNGQKRPEGFDAWYSDECLSSEAGGLCRGLRHAAARRPFVVADA